MPYADCVLRMKKLDVLTPKKKAFCDAYLINSDAKEAAAIAGYSRFPSAQHRLLRDKTVIKYLKKKRSQLDKRVENSFLRKLKKLNTITESVVGDTPDTVDKQYAHLAISSIREANLMQGHHAPSSTIVVNIEQDEHLKRINEVAMQILAEDQKQLGYQQENKE